MLMIPGEAARPVLAVTRLVGTVLMLSQHCLPLSLSWASPPANPVPPPSDRALQPPNSSHTENCALSPWLLNLGWVGVELGLLVPLFLNLHSGFSWPLPPIGVKLDLGSSLHSLEGT